MLMDQLLLPARGPSWRAQSGHGSSEEQGTRAGAPNAAEVSAGELLKVVYVGISGVLHPSASLYKFIHGRSPWNDGRSEYESVPILEAALTGWPDAKVVLTSVQPWAKGLESVLERLGPGLARRVIGFTYEDLTSEGRPGAQPALSSNGYWRLMKSEIVRLHLQRLQPSVTASVCGSLRCTSRSSRAAVRSMPLVSMMRTVRPSVFRSGSWTMTSMRLGSVNSGWRPLLTRRSLHLARKYALERQVAGCRHDQDSTT
jgi:hypothetical protein